MDKGSANGVRRWRFRWSNRWPIKARRTHAHTRSTDYYNTYMPGRVRTKVQRRTREIIAYTNQEPRDRLINVARSFLSFPRNSLLNRACISMRNLHVTRSRNAERARASTLFMVCFSCSLIKPIATESARVLRSGCRPLPYFQSIPRQHDRLIVYRRWFCLKIHAEDSRRTFTT